ncbi:MAG: hypothetical protein ACREQ5_24750 [Candidatus Dormibacteria bacterium]
MLPELLSALPKVQASPPLIGVNALFFVPGKIGGAEIYVRDLLTAIDARTGYLARRVVALLDGRTIPVRTGIARPDILKVLIDDALLHRGIAMTIAQADFGTGAHVLSLAIDDLAAGSERPLRRRFTIIVGMEPIADRSALPVLSAK